jgi:hypothetical protein
MLVFSELIGWVFLLLQQPVGLVFILAGDGLFLGNVVYAELTDGDSEKPAWWQRNDLLLLLLLYGIEVGGAIVWFENKWMGVALLLGGSLAAGVWMIESGLMRWPPDDDPF